MGLSCFDGATTATDMLGTVRGGEEEIEMGGSEESEGVTDEEVWACRECTGKVVREREGKRGAVARQASATGKAVQVAGSLLTFAR